MDQEEVIDIELVKEHYLIYIYIIVKLRIEIQAIQSKMTCSRV